MRHNFFNTKRDTNEYSITRRYKHRIECYKEPTVKREEEEGYKQPTVYRDEDEDYKQPTAKKDEEEGHKQPTAKTLFEKQYTKKVILT